MAIVSDVEIRLRADIARLQQDMTAARNTVNGALGSISEAAGKLKTALSFAAVAAGLAAFVSKVVDAQREFDKLNAGLVTATGSTANAAQAFKALQQFAATTPYSVQEATEAFIKLRNLGLDPSEKALRSYGNTAASQGKSLNQFIEAVADASTGEFERLKEFGIKAKQNGDLVSLTFQGVTKNIGNNAKDIQAYLMRIGEVDFAGAMERRANTLDGVISNLGDSWQAFLLRISGNGVGQVLASTLIALSNSLSDLGDILEIVGGKASTESGKIKEATAVHIALTGAFKVVATIGIALGATIKELGEEFGALAAVLYAFSQGDFDGIKRVMAARLEDAKANSKWASDKIKAVWGAAQEANAARDSETANTAKNNKDQLAQFGVVLSADEKRANALLKLIDVKKKLLGIDPQDIADQKAIKTALETGAISQAEYTQLMAQSNKQIQANSLAYKQAQKNLDGQAESINRASEAETARNQQLQQRIAFLKQSGQLDDAAAINQTADAEVANLNAQIMAQGKLLAIAKQRQDSQKDQASINGQVAKLKLQIDNAEEKRKQDLLLLDQQRYKVAIDNTANLIEAAQNEALAQKAKTRDMQDEIDTLGLTGVALAQVTAARLRDQAAALDRRAEIGIIEEVNDRLRQQADELRKQADRGLTRAKVEEQQKFWGDVEQVAHDSFVSIADGGKDLATRLRQSLKNIFFDWLYQMTLKKWVIQVGASVDGTSAVAGISTGANSSNVGNLANTATNIYKAISGGFESLSSSVADAVQSGLYASGLSSNIASNGAFAQGAGSLASGLAGAAAGYGLGNLISGQYGSKATTAFGTAAGAAIGSIVPGLGTALGALVGGALGGVVNRLFGMGSKQYSDNSTLTGMLGGAGFSGTVNTAYTQKGGLFRSDRSGVDKNSVDAATAATLDSAYAALKMSTEGFAKALGINADSIASRTDALNITLGKDAAANQKAITDYFTGLGDTFAQSLLPNIAQFIQDGETAATTLQRLATDYVALDAVLTAMGTDSQKAFGAVGTASLEARERLISLAGGLDALVTQVQYFNDNFLTDAEKIAPVQKEVNAQLAALGLTGVTTIDQFKTAVQALVDSGALATESGAKQYAALLAIAPKYKQVSDYLDAVAKANADAAANAQQAAEAAAKAAADAAQAAQEAADAAAQAIGDNLKSTAQAAFGALQRSVDARKKQLQTSFDMVMAGLQAGIDAAASKVSNLQDLSDTLKSSGLPGTTTDRATAQAQLATAIALARAGGVLPAASDVKSIISALSGDTTDQFASLQDYMRDQLLTANNIEQLSGLTDDQLSIAQLTLNALNAQKDAAQKAYDDEIASLDNMVAVAQMQLDAINGVDDSVIGLTLAFGNFADAIRAALGNTMLSSQASVSTQNQIEALYNSILGRSSDAGGLAYYLDKVGSGVLSLADVTTQLLTSPEYRASHPPSAVDTGAQYGTMAKPSTDQKAINDQMQSSLDSIADSVGQLAGQFDRVSGGGNLLATQAM